MTMKYIVEHCNFKETYLRIDQKKIYKKKISCSFLASVLNLFYFFITYLLNKTVKINSVSLPKQI